MNGPNPRNSTICHKDIGHAVTGLLVQTYGYVVDELRKNGIDVKLPLGTVDGDAVRIIAIDTDHKFGIVGEIIDTTTEPATCWLARWNLAGTYCGTKEAAIKHSIAKNAPYFVEVKAPPAAEEVPVNPVHDEPDEFADEFARALAGPRPPAVSAALDAANGAADTLGSRKMSALDEIKVREHAEKTILKNNKRPPKKLTPAQIKFAVGFHRAYRSLTPETRAWAICGLNSALGRFALYSRDGALPPTEEIMHAAEHLDREHGRFYACVDPETSAYWRVHRSFTGLLSHRELPEDAREFMREVERLNGGPRR